MPPSPNIPSQEVPDPEKRCLHHDFVEHHHRHFRKRARQLAVGDRAMQDDLAQEMCLAVLEYDKAATPEYLFELAANRAIDYLRYEAMRGEMPLSNAREPSDKFAQKTESLDNLIEKLMQDGIPKDWIEEAIGWRLEAA